MKRLTIKFALISAGLFFITNCASGGLYHGNMMRGSVVSATGSEGVICIGSKDGATVGQILNSYKGNWQNEGKTARYARTPVGSVKITEIIDEHFAKVTAVSGKIEMGTIVELESK